MSMSISSSTASLHLITYWTNGIYWTVVLGNALSDQRVIGITDKTEYNHKAELCNEYNDNRMYK